MKEETNVLTDITEVTDTPDHSDTAHTAPTANIPAPPPSRIPGETERPCYRVLDDWVTEGSTKHRPGVWYFGIRYGTGKNEDKPPTLTQSWICSPLHIEAVTTDASNGNYGRLLRFKTTLGQWRTWAMPMELLSGDGNSLRSELLAMGVEIDPSARNLLAMYLQDKPPAKRIRCVLQTGWADIGFGAFALPDVVIGPKAAQVAYQSGERGQDEYTTAGTLEGWQVGIAAQAVGNPLLMLAICTAFAGPVLARCNAESGGIHFVGDSSTGKTTAIEAACSVWGGPNFRRSWRATGNGMEGVAALFNDSLLALDEISECDPREVGAIVYALGNGRGKQRASRSGAARTVTKWRCSVLSSGERTIGTTMADGGHRIKAGQSVRLLDIPAQRKHGAWDELHQSANGTAFSDGLKTESVTHYGHAGRAFLEKLSRDKASFTEALDKVKAMPVFAVVADDGQVKRAAGRFAVIALAGELATEYGVTGWTQGEAIAAAGVGFAAWQLLRGTGKGNSERDQISERIASFIERHGDSRFSNADAIEDDHMPTVRDRAGWWQDGGGHDSTGRVYLFTADGMREAVKGFDFNRALDALQELGAIDAPGAGKERAKSHRMGGRKVRVYAVNAEKLAGVA